MNDADLKNGHAGALARVYEEYRPLVRFFVRGSPTPPEWSEDLEQSVWLEVVRSFDSLCQPERSEALVAWLRTIVRRCTADQFRKERRDREHLPKIARRVDTPPLAEDRLLREERVASVCLVLKSLQPQLTPLTWRAFQLCELGDLRPCEAARQLNMSPHEVSQRLYRARRAFRCQWRRHETVAAATVPPLRAP